MLYIAVIAFILMLLLDIRKSCPIIKQSSKLTIPHNIRNSWRTTEIHGGGIINKINVKLKFISSEWITMKQRSIGTVTNEITLSTLSVH